MEQYYHYYRMVHCERTDKVIDGLHLVFIELPKFKPHSYGEKRMQVLWLRYLTEITEQTRQAPQELLDNPEVHKALAELEESAFSEAELEGYDKFWDTISVERTLINSAKRRYDEGLINSAKRRYDEGMEKGMAEGLEKGMEKGMEKGRAEGMEKGGRNKQLEIASNLKQMGMKTEAIAQATGLSSETIENL